MRDFTRQAKEAFSEVVKGRVYVDSPAEAPEGVDLREGERGGLWYPSEQEPDSGEAGASEGGGSTAISPDELSESHVGSNVAVQADGKVFEGELLGFEEVAGAGDGLQAVIQGDAFVPSRIKLDDIEAVEVEGGGGEEAGGEEEGGGEELSAPVQGMVRDFTLDGIVESVRSEYGDETADTMKTQIQTWHDVGLEEAGATVVDDALTGEPENELEQAWSDFSKASKAWVRENYGDSVTLHRGVHGEHAANIKAGEVEIDGPPASSWTLNSNVAADYADHVSAEDGVVMTREVSPEEVAYAPVAFGGLFEDMEEIMLDQTETWNTADADVEVIA